MEPHRTTLSVCDLDSNHRSVVLHVDGRMLVSFVFNRALTPFGDAECELAEALRPLLATLYRLSGRPGSEPGARLTAREREVLAWVAAGKTNRDIAAILGARPRTIDKHLEHVYEKLGVETRMAAVMRANAL